MDEIADTGSPGEGNHVFDVAAGNLDRVLEDAGKKTARSHLLALAWSLRDAPGVGLALAEAAAERMKQGQHMDDDLVRDAVLTWQLTWSCYQESQFVLESSLRYLHATGDLLAQLVNSTLELGLSEKACSLPAVLGSLPTLTGAGSAVGHCLRTLQDSPAYRYVADATNRMKHRSVLGVSIGARLGNDGEITVGQHLPAFSHDDRRYAEEAPGDVREKAEELQRLEADVLDALRASIAAT